jgi:hypothetical protein
LSEVSVFIDYCRRRPDQCHFTRLLAAAAVLCLSTAICWSRPAARTVAVTLRGKTQSVQIFDPEPGAPKREVQVLVTSGDLGWLGISGDVPGHLQDRGYRVIGLNARTYVSSFTGKDGAHLEETWIPADYQAIVDGVADPKHPRTYVSVGVSEGAGLAVVAMGQQNSDIRCLGVIALGLPMKTALGWRWTDFTAWISKREPDEPEVDTKDFVLRLKGPIVMVHSVRDEYDKIDSVRGVFDLASEPKRFVAVDASNHRFSNKISEVLALLDTNIPWIASVASPAGR